MDGKGFDDSGLGERYSYASEPDETEDPLPRRRPAPGPVVQPDDDETFALTSRPHDPDDAADIAQYRAWGEDSGYEPERYPSEPYVGSPRVGRPYVTGMQAVVPPADPAADLDNTGRSGNGYAGSGDGGHGYDVDSHSGNGYDVDPYGGKRYDVGPYGGNGYGSESGDGSLPPVYRGRVRIEAQAQPLAGEFDVMATVGGSGTYHSRPAIEAGDGRGALAVQDLPFPELSTRPGYSLSEDLAEQRRQDALRAEEAEAEDRRQMPLWQEMPLLLVVAFCVAVLIRSFLVQAFFIPSSSMEQTLLIGDRVLVNKILYDVRPPARGEVVVFRGTDRWAPENFGDEPGGTLDRIGDTLGDLVGVSRPGEKDFIKRVIGVPGDRVECCDEGRVMVNGVAIDEPYIDVNSPLEVPQTPNVCGSRRFAEVVVPEDHLFVMGDNRAVSQDSRCQGTVPIENVIGRAFLIVWPSGRWDTLSVPDSFDAVPPPLAVGPATPARPDPIGAVVALPLLASLVGSSGPRLWRQRRARRLPR
jgi:signal peptidase I